MRRVPALRAFAFAAGVAALAGACTAQQLSVSGSPGTGGAGSKNGIGGSGGITTLPAGKVDMLFVIDDSSVMTPAQATFLRNFPSWVTSLKMAPGLPDLHVAVISSDLGAGDGSFASSGCDASGGKRGVFQHTPTPTSRARMVCQSVLDPNATFVTDGTERNYTGLLED